MTCSALRLDSLFENHIALCYSSNLNILASFSFAEVVGNSFSHKQGADMILLHSYSALETHYEKPEKND